LKRAVIALMFCLAGAISAEDYGIFIREANLTKRDGQTFLSADVDYRFTPAAIDALEHGIALTLVLRLTVHRERAYWFDENVITERRNIELRYHPLAKSFQIADLDSGAVQSFASFAAVTDTLSRIRGWPIQNVESLDSHQSYLARLELTLDIESLPLPLRAEAYVSPSWRLAHPLLEWRLTP
jgi:hypothetical protein